MTCVLHKTTLFLFLFLQHNFKWLIAFDHIVEQLFTQLYIVEHPAIPNVVIINYVNFLFAYLLVKKIITSHAK